MFCLLLLVRHILSSQQRLPTLFLHLQPSQVVISNLLLESQEVAVGRSSLADAPNNYSCLLADDGPCEVEYAVEVCVYEVGRDVWRDGDDCGC